MAIATPCQTSGAVFTTRIRRDHVLALVQMPEGMRLDLTEAQAETLEANLHNALELVLAPYFF